MNRFLTILFVAFSCLSFAQEEEEVHSIFFEFDKSNLKNEQADAVVAFVSKIDTSRIASVQIFGYCDDRGKDEYNYILSTNRANTVKNKLVERGIKSKIINRKNLVSLKVEQLEKNFRVYDLKENTFVMDTKVDIAKKLVKLNLKGLDVIKVAEITELPLKKVEKMYREAFIK